MSFENYPAFTGRRKLLILALGVATAVTVLWAVLERPGGLKGPKAQPAGPPLCSTGQTRDCVGGQVDVIVAPAASAAAR